MLQMGVRVSMFANLITLPLVVGANNDSCSKSLMSSENIIGNNR